MLLKYKVGEKTIVVPSDATVGNLIPGDKADPGNAPAALKKFGSNRYSDFFEHNPHEADKTRCPLLVRSRGLSRLTDKRT
jgi:hypothetical protein